MCMQGCLTTTTTRERWGVAASGQVMGGGSQVSGDGEGRGGGSIR